VEDFLLNEVLLKSDYQVIRAFLDGLLEKSQPSEQDLKGYGEKLNKLWNEREIHRPLADDVTVLHVAAIEDNARIIGFLLDILKSEEHSDVRKKMLLATDTGGQTALHMAAEGESVQALKEIRKWADEANLNTTELKNKLLLATDMVGYTALQLATKRGSLQALEIFWNWAREVGLKPEELLLAQNREGLTVLHMAASVNHVGILLKLWVWAEEAEPNSN
jgi:ankyrin repeat protein